MATVSDNKSMNEASDRDPFNNNSYGTLVDDGYKKISLPVLDVDDFNERIIRAYEDGTAEKGLPADLSVSRSLVPAGTATLRDFSYVAPEIPEYINDNCTGCMDCVTLCPDTAILGKVVGEQEWENRLAKIENEEDRELFKKLAWSEPSKYYAGPKKKTGEGGKFSIIIDPSKCKGCAECVTVCDDDALKMVQKTDNLMSDISKVHRMFKEFGPSDERYVSDKLLIDMMLKEQTHIYVGGAGSCAGCGEGSALRMMCAATGAKYGNDWGIIAATGCNTVYTSTYPYNPYLVPWSNSLFENAPAYAMGLRVRWDQKGWSDKPIWCIGGDGAMFDIGFQSLSRMLASGMNIKVLVLDTQVYSNTGGQASTSTYMGQNAKMSVHGKAIQGKTERRKEIAQIAMMHPRTFVAQTTCAHTNHFYRSCIDAMEFDGPAIVCCYTTCQPEHGVADNMATDQARLAVDTRAFPLMSYDPRKGDTIRERLSLQGNPAVNDDWWQNPKSGEQVDFIDFCRSEGRFSKHFDKDGNPSEMLHKAKQERLENWKQLQELAGVLGKKSAAKAAPAATPAKKSGSNGNGLPGGFSAGAKIRYDGGAGWVTGVLRSVEPVILDLDDNSEIEVSRDVLREAISVGIVALQ
ncbi:MAG: thiamine pyrophosphate-dependent enzyme [Pirellulaceae bacterium]